MAKHIFKRTICFFMVMTLCFIIFGQSEKNVMPVEAKTEAQLDAEIKASQQKQKELQSLINSTKGDLSKEKENQQAISQQISTTESVISSLETKISNLNSQISQSEANLAKQQQEIIQGVNDFKSRLRAMYLSGDDSYASILAGSSDFYDFLMKMELIKDVAAHDDKTISDLIAKKKAFEQQKKDLEAKKKEVESSKATYDKNKSSLDSLYSKSNDMIAQLNAQKASYEKMTAEQKKAQEAAEKELDRLIAEKQSHNTVFVGGTFAWPVPGYYYVSSGYGMRWGKMHKGIDIAGGGINGKPIVAANSGTVIIAMKNAQYGSGYGGYGNVLVIDHGGGYTTLYAHCSSLAVSVGQQVNKGQTVAYVGSSGNSTGPHLHFEIRTNNNAQDPMNWFKKS